MVPQSNHQLQVGRQAKQTRQKKPQTHLQSCSDTDPFPESEPLIMPVRGVFFSSCSPFHSSCSGGSSSVPIWHVPLPSDWLRAHEDALWGDEESNFNVSWRKAIPHSSLHSKISFSSSLANQLGFFFPMVLLGPASFTQLMDPACSFATLPQ